MRNEDALQESCVKWFRLQYKNSLLSSFPAGFVFGGDKIKRMLTALRMKRMGYTNGIPDLFIMTSKGGYHGMFIELKTERGKLSEEQKEILSKLTVEGFYCVVIRSIGDFINQVNQYMNGLIRNPETNDQRKGG